MVELQRKLKRDISVLSRLAGICETREGEKSLQSGVPNGVRGAY